MQELHIDEEFKSLIPPLSTEEYEQLEKNVITDGCREPLVVWNGTIIDGHNRYQICTEHDIEFQTVKRDFKDRHDAIRWIILNQFGRRNLTIVQRGELALKLKPIIQKKAKKNQEATQLVGKGIQKKSMVNQNSDKPIDTCKEIAKLAGVSHDTIWKTEKILNEGTQEQINRAREGGKGNSVSAIYKEVVGKSETKLSDNVETKVCKSCGQELPATEFYPGKGDCKSCFNSKTSGSRMKNVKGEVYRIADEYKDVKEEDCIGDLYNVDKEIKHTVSEAVEVLMANIESSMRSLDSTLDYYMELLQDEDNNKKIMTVLSEAATAIENMKGKYSYERL